MKVLLVQGALIAEQMAHWRVVSGLGVELHVVCALREELRGSEANRGVSGDFETHVLHPIGWLSRGHLWWLYPGLRTIINGLRPDVIHVTAEVYGLFYSQVDFDRFPIVGHVVDNIWTHGSWIERSIRLKRARRVLQRLSGVASWNTASLELARQFGMRSGTPTAVVPARIADPAPFREARAERTAHRSRLGFGDELTIAFMGRLVPEKGVDWLLEAFAEAAARDQARLVICGTGPSETGLRELAADLDLDVQFLGAIPPAQVPIVLAAVDLIIVPSLTVSSWAEQFGRVIVESMFAGTPVIASASGSIPEVVGEAGILVQEGDRAALTAAIDRLAHDERLRDQVAERGTVWALERYAPEVLARTLVQLWGRAIDFRESTRILP